MLAPTERRRGRAALSAPEQAAHCWNRHREERSDAAIQTTVECPTTPGLLRSARNDDRGSTQMQFALLRLVDFLKNNTRSRPAWQEIVDFS